MRLAGGLYHVLLRPTGSRSMNVRTLTAVDGAGFCIYAVPHRPVDLTELQEQVGGEALGVGDSPRGPCLELRGGEPGGAHVLLGVLALAGPR